MSVIGITGTSGVGKSFLAKQLASLNACPVFLEGEIGVIPSKFFANVASGQDPTARIKWFFDRCINMLNRARDISDTLKMNTYVDFSISQIRAILHFEDAKYAGPFLNLLDEKKELEPDRSILLTLSPDSLREWIVRRGREGEQRDDIFKRAEVIQTLMIEFAGGDSRVTLMNRDGLDFSDEETLKSMDRKIKLT